MSERASPGQWRQQNSTVLGVPLSSLLITFILALFTFSPQKRAEITANESSSRSGSWAGYFLFASSIRSLMPLIQSLCSFQALLTKSCTKSREEKCQFRRTRQVIESKGRVPFALL